jgi:hypothetical protein
MPERRDLLRRLHAGRRILRVDDDGTGTGVVSECDEDNNVHVYPESFCGR